MVPIAHFRGLVSQRLVPIYICGPADPPLNVSNPVQNRSPVRGIFDLSGIATGVRAEREEGWERGLMELDFTAFRNRLRRRAASVTGWCRRLVTMMTPQIREMRLQRMCPFCGLITPSHKTSCLECGKSLRPA